MMNTETIKQEIIKLVEKYNKVVEEKRISKYNEEMTKKDFILPLFRALGWNTEDSNEVTAEEKISKKRVDYGFRINGIPKFFLEAKAIKEDLDNPKFIEQAINYAWHKGCTWAVLTDFESVKIFNAEWKTTNPLQSHLKTIPCQEFLDRFNELWLLSKESFEQGLIDKEAEKWGKKTKKISVDKQLLLDFTRFRELLSKNIIKLNQSKNLTEEELDESVQRILDRLIFIRNCEDRELEPKTLISSFREWESRGRGQLIKSLREVFAYFDQQYNSKIFANHLCDSLDIDNEVLHEIIEGLYFTKDKSVSYDFSAIEADVLGNIYEQYLGHILKKSEKRAKLTKSHAHRKEQGIYYTPTYIVDYIVRNTLGELLKDKKVNPEKIRVLDPACGSGSFLIKAFDVLNEYYKKHDKNYDQAQLDFKTGLPFSTKLKILKNNIFGVDLDKQAVEIAQLNLLLKVAEKGRRLPLLQENIKCGNSLIDDPAIAGDKAFKWEEEFKEIMQEGGFDVVVGNPPYGVLLNRNERNYFLNKYSCRDKDINSFVLFIEKGCKLVKDKGYLGFIIPKNLIKTDDYENIRRYIFDNFAILSIVDCGKSFEEVTGEMVILIVRKEKKHKNNTNIFSIENGIFNKKGVVNQSEFGNLEKYRFNILLTERIANFIKHIKENSLKLEDLVKIFRGIETGKKDELIKNIPPPTSFKKIIAGKDLDRYRIKNIRFIEYKPNKINFKDETMYNQPKIVVRKIANHVHATFDEDNLYTTQGVYIFNSQNISQLKYILGMINSKLLHWYYEIIFNMGSHLTTNVTIENLRNLPIKLIPESEQQPLINLVDKMLSLNKRLNEIGDKKTDERAKIEEEIKKIDAEIDELVYKIYSITEEEKKIIEESLK